MWDPGTVFIADHTKIHAGPLQELVEGGVPRMVLFTTFTIVNARASFEPTEYRISDQFLPHGFAEDHTMPSHRAQSLLREWKREKPWLHYPAVDQSKACQRLCLRDPETDGFPSVVYGNEQVKEDLRILRGGGWV
jgi:hypothetical protein